jgi:hypothetical protein
MSDLPVSAERVEKERARLEELVPQSPVEEAFIAGALATINWIEVRHISPAAVVVRKRDDRRKESKPWL